MERNAKMPRRKPIQWDEPVEGSESYIEPPATTRSGRDAQMVDLAYRCVERRMRDGTASSQEIIHFLKLGSEQTELEREKLRHETALLEQKRQVLEEGLRDNTDYANVIAHLRLYKGLDDD
jgi:hypothetical protein